MLQDREEYVPSPTIRAILYAFRSAIDAAIPIAADTVVVVPLGPVVRTTEDEADLIRRICAARGWQALVFNHEFPGQEEIWHLR